MNSKITVAIIAALLFGATLAAQTRFRALGSQN